MDLIQCWNLDYVRLNIRDRPDAVPIGPKFMDFSVWLGQYWLPQLRKFPEITWDQMVCRFMRSLRIFLVENHEDTARYLRLYLERLGHTVTLARDYSSALDSFKNSRCQLLISDIRLPDGDGWTLMKKLRGSFDICGIAMSGYITKSDREQSAAAGFRCHLVKPFAPSELEKALQELAVQVPAAEI